MRDYPTNLKTYRLIRVGTLFNLIFTTGPKTMYAWNRSIFPKYAFKVWTIENNTDLNSIFCLIKNSKIDFIYLPAFYLIMWLMTSSKNFEKIIILKKWQLVFFWGVKTYFGEIPLKWCIFRHEIFYFHQYCSLIVIVLTKCSLYYI